MTEKQSTINFEYQGRNYTAHLTHITDPAGTPHSEIDKIVDDDTGDEVEDDHIYNHFFDEHCPL